LNPLVKIDPRPTLLPFHDGGSEFVIDGFLREEKVDLVCATDLTKKEMVSLWLALSLQLGGGMDSDGLYIPRSIDFNFDFGRSN
jgi:hypothetical protein